MMATLGKMVLRVPEGCAEKPGPLAMSDLLDLED